VNFLLHELNFGDFLLLIIIRLANEYIFFIDDFLCVLWILKMLHSNKTLLIVNFSTRFFKVHLLPEHTSQISGLSTLV